MKAIVDDATQEAMEMKVKKMVEQSMKISQKDEKFSIEEALQSMRREMDAKIAKAGEYKEQFVFEDLKPSVMFKNVLDHREKRQKHLRLIFQNYAKAGLLSQLAIDNSKQPLRRGGGGGGGSAVSNSNGDHLIKPSHQPQTINLQ